jgi:hypothetical protein
MQIGSRLEPFIDRYLLDKVDGLELKMHAPQPAPAAPEPIRGHYVTVIKDGESYRGYYRDYVAGYQGPYVEGSPGEITCYAESRDGHHWEYPRLGLYDVHGTDGNNIILADEAPFSHNFSPFLEARPGVPSHERYKALAGIYDGGNGGLFAFVSRDGLRWKWIRERAVITSKDRAFDSQNVAFWSEVEGCYACYYRTWDTPHGRLRTISRVISHDFVHWSSPMPLNPNVPGEHLYTSSTHPYFRAPHIYVALPTRFLPERGGTTDVMLMTSRGGARYDRLFMEAFIRPGLEPDKWGNRANYVAQNVVPTGPGEMSLYVAPGGHRYVLRADGFVSLNAGYGGGEMLTKAFEFTGSELVLNYSTSAAGSIGVEMQSPDGKALPQFGLADCVLMVGDEIEGVVRWRHGSDVSTLSGQRVRLRYVLRDADIYSMRFRESSKNGSTERNQTPAEAP